MDAAKLDFVEEDERLSGGDGGGRASAAFVRVWNADSGGRSIDVSYGAS